MNLHLGNGLRAHPGCERPTGECREEGGGEQGGGGDGAAEEGCEASF